MRTSVLASFVALLGCYDSTWGESKRAQEHTAAAMAPSALHGEGAAPVPVHPFRVRAFATPAFAAETLDWAKELAAIVDDANQIATPAIGLRLVLVSTTPWPGKAPDGQDLPTAMTALQQGAPAEDADFVLGLVGGLPKVNMTYDQIGLAVLGGRHLVMRSSADLTESDAIDKGLSELDPGERSKLVRARRRHRAVVVLLHEVGHSLLAVHDSGKEHVMSPAYSPKVDGFGPDATELLRLSVKLRADKSPDHGPLRAYYAKADKATWVPEERAHLLTMLDAKGGPSVKPATPAPIASVPVVGLSTVEQATYDKARVAFETGDLELASTTGRSLFEKRLDVYEVQDLRCKIALRVGVATKSECAALMEFAKAKKKP